MLLEFFTQLYHRWRTRARTRLPANREFESAERAFPRRRKGAATLTTASRNDTVICPRCERRVTIDPLICSACGFPFICDITPVDTARVRQRVVSWRTALGIAALLFWLGNVAVVASGTDGYQGHSNQITAMLSPDTASGIPMQGPGSFIKRTQLVLDLMRLRAPDAYFRMQRSVTSIDFLGQAYLPTTPGHGVSLEGIGAISTPDTGRVQVLLPTAFPSGLDELWDADLFSYAGVLVHELRHIELHHSGLAPGGWQEEVLCEESAYAAVKEMGAPGAILARYELYLSDPQAKRYQSWYRWYDQFD